MKNVLMIAYYFPPLGGGGVQRTTKFVKYLRDFGYNPIVLTVEPRCVRKVKDPTLLSDIPAGTEVHRTFTIDADWLFKLLYGLRMVWLVHWLVRTVFVPDIQILWLPFVRRKMRKIVRSRSIDMVFISGTPFSSFFLGIYAKKRFGLPVALDFRDEWIYHGEYFDNPPGKRIQKREKRMEETVLRYADMMTVVNRQVRKNFLDRYPFLEKIPIEPIPNGYDEDDFRDIERTPRSDGVFRMVFSGTLYGKRRNIGILLQSVRELISEGAIDEGALFIDIYGRNAASNVLRKGDESFACVHGYIPHRDIIEKTLAADMLILLVNPGPNCLPDYPGKVSEYLRTGVPILAIVPAGGSVDEVITRTGTGFVADSHDLAKVKETVLDCYRNWKNNALEIHPDWDEIAKYERKTLTGRLAKQFDNLLT